MDFKTELEIIKSRLGEEIKGIELNPNGIGNPNFLSKRWVSVESLKEWLNSDEWKTREDLLKELERG